MSCKSALYAVGTNVQTVTADETVINFDNIVRRYGKCVHLSGGNVTIEEAGYYDVDTNLTFTAGAAGTVVIRIYKDGVPVPGAIVSETVAAGSIYALSIPTIIRDTCNCESTITVKIAGVAGTVNNAAIAVERI